MQNEVDKDGFPENAEYKIAGHVNKKMQHEGFRTEPMCLAYFDLFGD